MLEIDDLRIGYGSGDVLDGLDWEVGTEGSVVTALLGPSGCGKSTLIRAVAGLEAPTAGSVRFDRADLAPVPPHRRNFGVVFQDGQLFAGRTVGANIAYGLRLRRWPRADIARRVGELLELVQLDGFAKRSVGSLSGGQAQRVALARALAPRPRLLLLDEPLAALDRGLRESLAMQIAQIVRATETPTIVVTHDHSEAALMADTVSVMRAGAIVQSARPGTLWRRPVDGWTARFLGCDSVVDADVGTDGLAQTALGVVRVGVGPGAVQLGLRPESVVATSDGATSDGAKADGAEPDGVEPDGSKSDGSKSDGAESDGAESYGAESDPRSAATVLSVAELPGGTRARVSSAVGEIDVMLAGVARPGDRVALRLLTERVAVIGR